MKQKRILAALLAVLMLTSSLTACGTADDPADTDAYTLWSGTEAETELTDNLPEDLYYDDDEITVISRYVEGWTSGEITVEGLKGEPVNDAVFERNKAVEERLGVQIKNIEEPTANVTNKVYGSVRSGDTDYDFMADACSQAMPNTLNGTFADLRTSAYLDFNQPWWTQGFHDAVEFKGSQYAVIGSMLLSMYRFGFVTVFNKSIFDNADQPYLYEYVADGTWTLDKQASLVPIFHKDDGNGLQDREGDIYGLITSNYTNIDAYWSSCQIPIVRKDDEGNYALVLDMDRLHGAADKILNLFYNTDAAVLSISYMTDDFEQTIIRQMFADGKTAMATFRVLEMENSVMRSMEDSYGVVPVPKYDELQEGYYTLLHDQFTVVCVPATVTGDHLDQVSAVLEALSSTSYRMVKPVYYEETLRTKIAQDPTAAEMMDIITDNVYIDAGIIFINSLGSYHHGLRSVIKSHSNNVASLYKAKNAACTRSLALMSQKLDKLADKNRPE